MSWIAVTGATLLGAATLPQAVQLLRTRRAGDFGWAFTVLNLLGLSLLAARSWVIEEWAFLAINVLVAGFWGLVLGVKVHAHRSAAQVGASSTTPRSSKSSRTRRAISSRVSR